MPSPDLATGAALYEFIALGTLIVLWIRYDRRDRLRGEEERRKGIFHCIRCDRLYTARRDTTVLPCPRCGHENTRLKF